MRITNRSKYRQKRVFLFFPKTLCMMEDWRLPSQTRWLEWATIEQEHYDDGAYGKGWTDLAWAEER